MANSFETVSDRPHTAVYVPLMMYHFIVCSAEDEIRFPQTCSEHMIVDKGTADVGQVVKFLPLLVSVHA